MLLISTSRSHPRSCRYKFYLRGFALKVLLVAFKALPSRSIFTLASYRACWWVDCLSDLARPCPFIFYFFNSSAHHMFFQFSVLLNNCNYFPFLPRVIFLAGMPPKHSSRLSAKVSKQPLLKRQKRTLGTATTTSEVREVHSATPPSGEKKNGKSSSSSLSTGLVGSPCYQSGRWSFLTRVNYWW